MAYHQSAPPQLASPALSDKLTSDQKSMIEAALAETKGRVSGPSGAAARLGMPASTLDSKIKALKIDKQGFNAPNHCHRRADASLKFRRRNDGIADVISRRAFGQSSSNLKR